MALDHGFAGSDDGRGRNAIAAGHMRVNRLLAGLPAEQLHRVRQASERVRPRIRQVLCEADVPIEHAWFPEGAVFSLLAPMSDGSAIETLTVGDEGIIGLPALIGATTSPTRVICQISGWAVRIPINSLIELAPRDGILFDRVMRYAHARMVNLSRSVACNRLHSAQQRYARWVLTTQDRAGTDEFPMTQDFIAQMLGITRPTVSLVGQELQANGIIHYAQGRITIDDRAGLERIACECYDIVRRSYAELFRE